MRAKLKEMEKFRPVAADAPAPLQQRVRNLAADAAVAVAAEETQSGAKTDANVKTKVGKHADAAVSGTAVCAEDSAVYSAVAADAIADNNSISRALPLCYIEKRSFYKMYHGFIL